MARKVKWPHKQCKRLPIPIYGQSVYFFTDRDAWNQAKAYLGDDNESKVGYSGHQVTYQNETSGDTIWMMSVFDGSLGTLVHETVHTAVDMCDTLGIGIDVDNHEAFAYLVGFIYEKLAPHVNPTEEKEE